MLSEWNLLESNGLYSLFEDARPGAPFRYMAEAHGCNGFGNKVSAALHDLAGCIKDAWKEIYGAYEDEDLKERTATK